MERKSQQKTLSQEEARKLADEANSLIRLMWDCHIEEVSVAPRARELARIAGVWERGFVEDILINVEEALLEIADGVKGTA
jgi:hypothetical protein